MAKPTIVWTKTATQQRRIILQYWTNRNGNTTYAKKLIQLIANNLKIIQTNPQAFKETEIATIRESAMGHFSIYYKTTPSKIIVMAFWDNRQNPKDLLKAVST